MDEQGKEVSPTDDDRTLKHLHDDGQVIGFLIREMSTLNHANPIAPNLSSEAPAGASPTSL